MTVSLNKAQEAALIILSLDERLAADVLRGLEPEELRILARAVGDMDPIPVDALNPTLEQFEKSLQGPVLPTGGEKYLKRLTVSALGQDRAATIFSEPEPTALDALKDASDDALGRILADEHPQLVAVILTQLPRARAAAVLMCMSEERQISLMHRIATLGTIPSEAIDRASEVLARALDDGGLANTDGLEFDGVTFAAGLMNELPNDDHDRLLEELEDRVPDLAPRIRDAMFTFEDLLSLDARGMQALMREVSSEQVLIALKTATADLKDKFFGAVSKRAAESMREDLEIMPPKRLSEVEEAQHSVVEVAMRLAADGQIVLGGSEELV